MGDERQRPDPDALLSDVQKEERGQARGRLKIFLGYAAGVGKTYAMLEAAHQRQAEGVDVVVAYVETHGRLETEAMLQGLEVLPRRQVEYRGVALPEMDPDAVLARRPQLALVDEMAHTNAPGSCHVKRYQDIADLLAAGISVYTTLNVQHLESLNDVVAQITGVTVQETVPDAVLDEAAELELTDLPPEELLARLRSGKVYVSEQAERAIGMFFRPGNLTALREVALRRAAARVDEQVQSYMQAHAIPGPWPAAEHLLVCVTPGTPGDRLVRTARRLAESLKAEWVALYVETPEHVRLPQAQQDRLAEIFQLVEELGGRTATVQGTSAADTVLQYARQHNVTKIIVGRPPRRPWRDLLRRSPVDEIIAQASPIDVYIVTGTAAGERREGLAVRPRWRWQRYLLSLVLVAAGTLLGVLVSPYLDPTNLVMIYLLVVVLTGFYLGRGPAIVASVLSVLAFDFFLVPPQLTLAVADTQYILTFFGLLAAGLTISTLTAQVREQVEAARRREAHTAALYTLSRSLAVATGVEDIVCAVVANVGEVFGRAAIVLLPEEGTATLQPHAQSSGYGPDDNEMAVADWVYQHGQPAGWGTDTLPAGQWHYLPLRTARGTVGVLGVRLAGAVRQLPPEQRRLLEAFTSLVAMAIEQAELVERARRAQLLEATEKLQTALLNSISHDLRTPLVSITGALSSLEDDAVRQDDEARRSLVQTAREEADRLNRLVGNLLEMTRLEAGAIRVALEPCDLQDVIGSALAELGRRLEGRPVVVQVPADLPLVPLDFVLIVHVLMNVIDNALKYSPAPLPIEIQARAAGTEVEIEVADRGSGIPPEDLARVFDKFYRVQRPGSVAGTGLGLSISKGLVEAHGGRIWAQNRSGGGTVVTLALPMGQPERSMEGTQR
jgi:two-component system sensor histidine kinase KdpD